MRAVDTNVLVRVFTGDDAEQAARAKEFMRPGAWVSHIVLVETIWVLRSVYERNRREIQQIVELLLSNESVVLEQPNVVAAALELFTKNGSVTFSDCLILCVAKNAGHTPLGTFDAKLAKIDGVRRIA